MGELRNTYKFLVGKHKGRDYSEDLSVDGRIILDWILGKQDENMWTKFIWLRIGTGGELL
jgi:hypothetical protein